ncbi:hypothetical protein N7467_011880 [Penicillium canescens]|nr:hypothetical protein N7467_011880 [Penicillium canescens]
MPQIDRLTPRLQKELDSIDPWDAEFPPAVASDIGHTSTDTASTSSENAFDIRSQIGPWNAEFPSLDLGNDGIDPLNAEFPHLLAFNTDHTSTDIPSTGSENGYTRSQTDTLGVGFPSLGLGNNAIDPLNAEFPSLLAFDTDPTSTDLPSTSSGNVFDTTSQTHHTSANF